MIYSNHNTTCSQNPISSFDRFFLYISNVTPYKWHTIMSFASIFITLPLYFFRFDFHILRRRSEKIHKKRNNRDATRSPQWSSTLVTQTVICGSHPLYLCTLVASRSWRSPGRFREVTGKQRANRAPSPLALTSFVRLANIWRKFRETERPQGVSPNTPPLIWRGVFIVSCDFYPLHLETEMHSFGDFSRSICVPVLFRWFGLRIRSDPLLRLWWILCVLFKVVGKMYNCFELTEMSEFFVWLQIYIHCRFLIINQIIMF